MAELLQNHVIYEAAVRRLEEISGWLDSDPEMIESMSRQELHEEMAEVGLDPDRPPPVLPGRTDEAPAIEPRLRLGSEKIALDTVGTEYSDAGQQARRRTKSSAGSANFSTTWVDRTRLWIDGSPDGEITRLPIGSLLGNAQFRRRLLTFCRSRDFSMFSGSYSAEDLYQDTCLKVFKCRSDLVAAGNILGEHDFWGWLFIVTRNQYYNRVRQFKKGENNGWFRCEKSVEDLDKASTEYDYEGQHLLSRFRDFIKGYSDRRQRAITLWLQGYSSREIVAKLESEVRCSHVTVWHWIKIAVDDFRRTLEAYETEPARSRALAARLFQRKGEDEAT